MYSGSLGERTSTIFILKKFNLVRLLYIVPIIIYIDTGIEKLPFEERSITWVEKKI